MEEEYEVGEYARTRAGHFYKVTKIDENRLVYWNKIQCGWSIEQLKDIVVKHSKNIINLIEVGDYVNGYKVVHIAGHYISVESSYNYDLCFEEQDIKSIVTHEQFESIKYKLEEDK